MKLSRIKVRQFFQMLAIEDFRTVFNFAVQRLTISLFNVHYIFDTDLTRAHELNDPGRPLPQGFTIRIFRGENEIGPIAGKLRRVGIASALLMERMKRGDLVVVVFDEDDEVSAYGWTTFTDAWMEEIRAALLLGIGETSGYDTFVLPRWRGKGLQYSLNARRFQHLSEHGHKRSLNWVNALNLRSLKSQASQRKRKVATVFSVPMLGVVVVRKCFPDVVIRVQKRSRWRIEVPQSSS
jgi:GNAT superfamily N-acetyltransferase